MAGSPSTRERVTDVTGQLRIRRRHRVRRRLLPVLIGVLTLALAGAGGWLVGFSRQITVEAVEVIGSVQVNKRAILAAAAVPTGTPLARVDTQPIADRVAALRGVDEVRVSKRWPHTVVIDVGERQAVYAIGTAGQYWLVDAKGVMFAREERKPSDQIIVRSPLTAREHLEGVATVVAALPAPVATDVTSMTASTTDRLTLKLGKKRIVWGSADESAVKAQVVASLYSRKSWRVIDVSSPSHPVLR